MDKANLGNKVRDVYTGFTGTIIAITHWINGCDRVVVQPSELDKDGALRKSETFDVQQIEIVEETAPILAKHMQAKPAAKKTGGPRDDAQRREDPSR